MNTRRRFFYLIPASVALLAAACKDRKDGSTATTQAPAPSPMPEPATPPQSGNPPASNDMGAPAPEAMGPMLTEEDPAAVALGYVNDTARADKVKYPLHAPGQQCAGCALYQGVAGADAGPCTIFPGKQVSAKGWCMSFVKKPT